MNARTLRACATLLALLASIWVDVHAQILPAANAAPALPAIRPRSIAASNPPGTYARALAAASLTATPASTRRPPSPTARTLNTRGEFAFNANNYELAITLFQQAIALDASFPEPYGNLGRVFRKTGRTTEAVWAESKANALVTGQT
jgi:Flp pilus assembly protein TadD